MTRFGLTGLSNVIDKVSSGWRAVIVTFAIASFIVAFGNHVTTVVALPAKLDHHILTADSVMTTTSNTLKEILHVNRQSLCLQVSQARHSDWTRCLIDPRTDP